MKILIYGINFTPELTGIGKYTGEMVAWLAEKGHDVEIITANPYYPQWEIAAEYRGLKWRREKINGVTVLRCPFYVPRRVTGMTRILHEASFVLSSLYYWLPRFFRRYDIVISVCPPFNLGVLPVLHNWIYGTPTVYHIQDLQVDAARNLGMIKNKRLLGFLQGMERWILKRVSAISSISDGMIDKIVRKGVPRDKVIYFPNWVDPKVVYPLPSSASMRGRWGFKPEDKIVMYAGNLGQKQGLDAVIEVARELKDQKHIHFLIVGEGGHKEHLMRLVRMNNLQNIHFYPLQPFSKLAPMLASADLHLVLQRKAVSDLVMPSKLTNILACGGKALVTAVPGSTLYRIIDKHEMGIIIPPEDNRQLKAGILKGLHSNGYHLQENAIAYARKYLDKDKVLNEFEDRLRNIRKPDLNYIHQDEAPSSL